MLPVLRQWWLLAGMLLCLHQGWAQSDPGHDLILKEYDMKQVVNDLVLDQDGFLWIATNAGLFRFDGYDFDLTGGESMPHLGIPQEQITTLMLDPDGNLWVGSKGLHVITSDRSRVISAALYQSEGYEQEVTSLLCTEGKVWMADYTSRIICFEPVSDTTGSLRSIDELSVPGQLLRYLEPLSSGDFLVGMRSNAYLISSPDGEIRDSLSGDMEFPVFYADTVADKVYCIAQTEIFSLDPWSNTYTFEFSLSQVVKTRSPSWIVPARYGEGSGIWMGNKKGNILWYAPKDKVLTDYTDVFSNRVYAGRFFSTHCAIPDGGGGLWVGTNQGLIHVLVPERQHFSTLPLPRSDLRQFSVRGMARLKDGSLLVGGYGGMFRYLVDGTVREYQVMNADAGHPVNPLAYDFLEDGDRVWIASEGNGLILLDLKSDTLLSRQWQIESRQAQNARDGHLWQFRFYKDLRGTHWIGTAGGLFIRKDLKTLMHFEQEHPKIRNKVYDIRETPDSILWVGSGSGLASISADRKTIRQHLQREATVTCVFPMQDGRIMFGIKDQGLQIYDPVMDRFEVYTTDNGLPDNGVSAIQSVEPGVYWIATNRGLSRFELAEKQFRNFYLEDGLPDNEFNHGSWLTDPDGTMYFGGVGGVVRVNPGKELETGRTPRIRVSKIAYHDGKAGKTRYMALHAGKDPGIRLGFRDKYFTVYYCTDERPPNPRRTYAYKLEGLHSDWQVNDTKNFVQFTGLQSGGYTLRIRMLTDALTGQENELVIPVRIGRPFYKQWWAYLLYVCIFGAATFLVVRAYFLRKHFRRRIQLESEHRQKLEEINKSKSTFFTNITHEFKTPLTLIQVPAEEISRNSDDEQITRHAHLISKNAKSMLALVNQLLALGKLEADLEQMHFHRLDLIHLMRAWIGNFDSLAKQKQIQLEFRPDQQALYMDFDPVKIETVINNLLSNAIRFSESGGHVQCFVSSESHNDGEYVSITVQDDGPGIDPEDQKYIFDRYYQGKNSQLGGTGIGLAFVREMVRVHGGSVRLSSVPGEGARFTILLPMEQKQTTNESVAAFPVAKTLPSDSTPNVFRSETADDKAVLLIAEDNPDVAQLVHDTFAQTFQVIVTQNGRDAHQKALEVIPDLVITDVMMPVMDGLSLTHQLKTDLHTSHIPVIMLTARDGVEARVEGRSHGADVYLNKPFSVNELQLTVRNLLYLRAQVRQSVTKQIGDDAATVQFSDTRDATFYKAFLTVLEDRFGDPDLSVQDFIQALGVSRTQLHRKLKAITGHSVNHIVRTMRLQRALSLLRDSGKSVSEVAYEVGFSTPSYFTERFREYYGYPPSEAFARRQSDPV